MLVGARGASNSKFLSPLSSASRTMRSSLAKKYNIRRFGVLLLSLSWHHGDVGLTLLLTPSSFECFRCIVVESSSLDVAATTSWGFVR